MEILVNNGLIENPTIEIVQNGEYEYGARISTDTEVLFNDPQGPYEHLVAIRRNDKLLRFTLLDAEPIDCTVQGSAIVYPSAFTDTDIWYNVRPGEIKEDIMLNSPLAPKTYTFGLESEGVAAQLNGDGSIEYVDSLTNEHIWTIQAPYALDANGADVPVSMVYGEGVYSLTVETNEETQYPVRLDPTITTDVTESLYSLNSLKTTSTKYGTYTFALAPYESSVSAFTSIKFRIYNSRSASYGGLDWLEWLDKDGVRIGAQVTNYVSETYVDVPSNACSVRLQIWAIRYDSLNATDTYLYLYGYGRDTDKALYYKKLNYTKAPTVTDPAPNSTYYVSLPGSAKPANVGTQSFHALPGCTFASGSRTYTAKESIEYGETWTADLKYFDVNGTQIGSTIAVAAAPYSIATRTVTVPEGAVRMDFSYSARCASTNSNSATFNFGGIISNLGTFGAYEHFSHTPAYSGTYRTSIAGNSTPTVPMRTFYSEGGGPWIEETTHSFTAGVPVGVIAMLGDNNQTSFTNWQSYFIYKDTPAPVEDSASFDLIRCTSVSSSTDTDTYRRVVLDSDGIFDTRRPILVTSSSSSDTARKLLTESISSMDTVRKLQATDGAGFDATRRLLKAIEAQGDATRRIAVSSNAQYDTLRAIVQMTLAVEAAFDTTRRVLAGSQSQFDTARPLTIAKSCDYDVLRRIMATTSSTMDTSRSVSVLDWIHNDTLRALEALLIDVVASYDTSRKLIYDDEAAYDTLRRAYSILGAGTVELSATFLADMMGVLRLQR